MLYPNPKQQEHFNNYRLLDVFILFWAHSAVSVLFELYVHVIPFSFEKCNHTTD